MEIVISPTLFDPDYEDTLMRIIATNIEKMHNILNNSSLNSKQDVSMRIIGNIKKLIDNLLRARTLLIITKYKNGVQIDYDMSKITKDLITIPAQRRKSCVEMLKRSNLHNSIINDQTSERKFNLIQNMTVWLSKFNKNLTQLQKTKCYPFFDSPCCFTRERSSTL